MSSMIPGQRIELTQPSLPTVAANPQAQDNTLRLPEILKHAWILNYLLSPRRFNVRAEGLQSANINAVADQARPQALKMTKTNEVAFEFKELFKHPTLSNSSPEEVYNLLYPNGLKVDPAVMLTLQKITLTLCFWNYDGSCAPIAIPLEPPFLEDYKGAGALRMTLLNGRSRYAPTEMSRARLNNPQEAYIDKVYDKCLKTVQAFNNVREQIYKDLSVQMKEAGYPAFTNARANYAMQMQAKKDELRKEHENQFLAPIFQSYSEQTGPITVQFVDLVEQAYFVLLGMVEVIDYSSKNGSKRFANAYATANAEAECMKAMSEHARLCRRLSAVCEVFSHPSPDDRYVARDFAFLNLSFRHEGGGKTNGGVSPLTVPLEALSFAQQMRGKLYVFVYPSPEGRIMLPANSFMALRDLNMASSNAERIIGERNRYVGEAIQMALNQAAGFGIMLDGELRDKSIEACRSTRAAAMNMLKVQDGTLAKGVYDEIGMTPERPCPEDDACLSERIEVATKSQNSGEILAQSLLNYGKPVLSCDPRGQLAQKLCQARVLRACATDEPCGVELLTGGNSKDDTIQFSQQICSPDQPFFGQLSTIPVDATPKGAVSDAKEIFAMVQKQEGSNKSNCLPIIRKCKKGDMARCIIAALVPDQIAENEGYDSFIPQRTACQTVRDTLVEMKRQPDWEALTKDPPCQAVKALLDRAKSSSPAARAVLQEVFDESCGKSTGIAASCGRYDSTDAFNCFMDALIQRITYVFQTYTGSTLLGIPPGTILNSQQSSTIQDLQRACQLVGGLAQLAQNARVSPGETRVNLPFLCLDISAMDMYLYASEPASLAVIEEGGYYGRPLAWALRETDKGSGSPAQYIDSSPGDKILRTALGAMYVYIVYKCIDLRVYGTSVGTQHTLGLFYSGIAYNLQAFPIAACAAAAGNIPYAGGQGGFDSSRRMDFTHDALVADYLVDRTFESVTHALSILKSKGGSGGSAASEYWSNQFRMLLAIMPFFVEAGVNNGRLELQVPFLTKFVLPLLHGQQALIQRQGASSSANSKVSRGARVAAASPLRARNPWIEPKVVQKSLLYDELIRKAFGVLDAVDWDIIGVAPKPGGGSQEGLPPVARGSLVDNILRQLKDQGESAPAGTDMESFYWSLWLVAILSLYKPELLQKPAVKEAATRFFENGANSFKLSTAHLFFRVLRMGGNEEEGVLGYFTKRAIDARIESDMKVMVDMIKKVCFVNETFNNALTADQGWLDGIGSSSANDYPGAVLSKGPNPDPLVCVRSKEFKKAWARPLTAGDIEGHRVSTGDRNYDAVTSFNETRAEKVPSFLSYLISPIQSIFGTLTDRETDVMPNVWSLDCREWPYNKLFFYYPNILLKLASLERQHMTSINAFVAQDQPWEDHSVQGAHFIRLLLAVANLYGDAFETFPDSALDGNPLETAVALGSASNRSDDLYALWEQLRYTPYAKFYSEHVAGRKLTWSSLSAATTYQQQIEKTMTMIGLGRNEEDTQFELQSYRKSVEPKLWSLLGQIETYARMTTLVGMLWGAFVRPSVPGGVADFSRENELRCYLIASTIVHGADGQLSSVEASIDSELYKKIALHPLFDPQRVIFQTCIPYDLIQNLADERNTRLTQRFKVQAFCKPLMEVLYQNARGAID